MKQKIKILTTIFLILNSVYCVKKEDTREKQKDSCYRTFAAVEAFPPGNPPAEWNPVFLAACLNDANHKYK